MPISAQEAINSLQTNPSAYATSDALRAFQYQLSGVHPMTFVNEFVPEEDVKKYDLDGLLNSYNPYSLNKLPHAGFKHSWTVDRERGGYFLPVKTVEEVGASGRNEPTNRKIFVLGWQDKTFSVELALSPETSSKIHAVPFKIVWELVRITPSELPDVLTKEILEIAKEALAVYGLWGVHRQVPNTSVEFKF